MTFSGGTEDSEFDYEARETPEFEFPIIPSETEKFLADIHGRAEADYESWKRDFLNWLYHEGKKPDRREGFAPGTIRILPT